MKLTKSWLVLAIGFGTLILLIALLGLGATRRVQSLHQQTLAAHQAYLETDALLREIPSDLNLSGILIRDYLLDLSQIMAPSYREQLLAWRTSIMKRLDVLAKRLGESEAARLQDLRTQVDAYWASMKPILEWSPQQKAAFSPAFLRQQVLPRRDAVASLAREISEVNAANLRKEQQRLQERQESLQGFLRRTVFFALTLGLLVAAISTARVALLENQSETERGRAEHAEEELRRLSRELVRAQEEERRSLSRELHDAIGQMLSAMTMELGNIETVISTAPHKVPERLAEARHLNVETIRSVRDLAMGLRPSMLDELGLAPALRWQGREFSRRAKVPVTVQIDGDLEGLPESHRTTVYRIVQEALTNCAKHAQASQIRISIYGGSDMVRLSIQDDGIGFDWGTPSTRGLGLIGIQERVRELDGKLSIISQPRKGTILEIELPTGVRVAAQ